MRLQILSYNIEGLTLEINYCHDQSLKPYIIAKNEYLCSYLVSLGADIICLQEYSPVFGLDLDKYYVVKQKPFAIFFHKENFSYVSHSLDSDLGLIVELKQNEFIFWVGTNRFPAGPLNDDTRKLLLQKATTYAKDHLFIYAVDTNMKKSEEIILDHLVDCFDQAILAVGYYTLDKKTNPYFATSLSNTMVRTRYDKIYCSKLFSCEQFTVLQPKPDPVLVHKYYPFGGISDHYPVLSVISLE